MTVTTGGRITRSDSSPSSLAELEVEGLEQLAVLVLGRDDLDDVVELLADQLERLVVDRLGRGDHLAEREQHLHQRGGVDADLLREVGEGRAAGQPHRLAVALADAHATDGGRLHLLELLATGALGLATATRRTAGAPEGTLGLATLTGSATATAGPPPPKAGPPPPGRPGAPPPAGAPRPGAPVRPGAPPRAGAPGRPGGPPRPASPPGPKAAGDLGIIAGLGRGMPGRAGRRAVTRRGRTRDAGVPTLGGRATRGGRGSSTHALRGRERVVAGSRSAAGLADRARVPGSGPWPGVSAAAGSRRASATGGWAAAAAGASTTGSAAGAFGPGLGAVPGRRLGGGRLGGRGLDDRGGLGGRGLGRRGLRGGGLLGRRGRGGRALAGQQGLAVLLLELHLDGKLDRRGGRLDELAHLLQLLENFLALDAVGLGELVNSGLSHNSPSGLETRFTGVFLETL